MERDDRRRAADPMPDRSVPRRKKRAYMRTPDARGTAERRARERGEEEAAKAKSIPLYQYRVEQGRGIFDGNYLHESSTEMPPESDLGIEARLMAVDERITDRCIELLNEALAMDAQAVTAIVGQRVRCNQTLAEHPTIQCRADLSFSVLGLLNGICGVFDDGPQKGRGPITAVFEQAVIVRFERTRNG
jgi:hypothetical protein